MNSRARSRLQPNACIPVSTTSPGRPHQRRGDRAEQAAVVGVQPASSPAAPRTGPASEDTHGALRCSHGSFGPAGARAGRDAHAGRLLVSRLGPVRGAVGRGSRLYADDAACSVDHRVAMRAAGGGGPECSAFGWSRSGLAFMTDHVPCPGVLATRSTGSGHAGQALAYLTASWRSCGSGRRPAAAGPAYLAARLSTPPSWTTARSRCVLHRSIEGWLGTQSPNGKRPVLQQGGEPLLAQHGQQPELLVALAARAARSARAALDWSSVTALAIHSIRRARGAADLVVLESACHLVPFPPPANSGLALVSARTSSPAATSAPSSVGGAQVGDLGAALRSRLLGVTPALRPGR